MIDQDAFLQLEPVVSQARKRIDPVLLFVRMELDQSAPSAAV
jgi:hypothetical protein